MMAVVHQVEQYEGTVEQEIFFVCLSVCLRFSQTSLPMVMKLYIKLKVWSRFARQTK